MMALLYARVRHDAQRHDLTLHTGKRKRAGMRLAG